MCYNSLIRKPIFWVLLFIILISSIFSLVESFQSVIGYSLTNLEKERLKELAIVLYERSNNPLEVKGIKRNIDSNEDPKGFENITPFLNLLKEKNIGDTKKKDALTTALTTILGESIEPFDNVEANPIPVIDPIDQMINPVIDPTMNPINNVSGMFYDTIMHSEFTKPGMTQQIEDTVTDKELENALKIILEKVSKMESGEFNTLVRNISAVSS
jgi:hypothetical protein